MYRINSFKSIRIYRSLELYLQIEKLYLELNRKDLKNKSIFFCQTFSMK